MAKKATKKATKKAAKATKKAPAKKAAKKATKKVAKKATKKAAPAKKATKKAPAKKATAKKATAKKATAKKAAHKKATKKAAKVKTKRKPNPAFMRPLTPSALLAAVVGANELPRTQAIKKIWEYIKKNGLQDGRDINADEKLKVLFGKNRITMFELASIVSKNLK